MEAHEKEWHTRMNEGLETIKNLRETCNRLKAEKSVLEVLYVLFLSGKDVPSTQLIVCTACMLHRRRGIRLPTEINITYHCIHFHSTPSMEYQTDVICVNKRFLD
jgi:hypothetical protein